MKESQPHISRERAKPRFSTHQTKFNSVKWFVFIGLILCVILLAFATTSFFIKQNTMQPSTQQNGMLSTTTQNSIPSIVQQNNPSLTATQTSTPSIAGGKCIGILIPAYFGTGPLWNKAVASAPAVKSMIANIDNGPGNGYDSGFATAIAQARNAGIRVFGYVDTVHGHVSLLSVETQIRQWKQYYNVVDIHLDDAYADLSYLPYYQALAVYIHANGGLSDLGIGDNPEEGYMQAGDIITLFEGTYDAFQSWRPARWVKNYPASRFTMDIYNIPDVPSMQNTLNLASQRHGGYFILTDSNNPWNELATPTFWQAEVATVKSACKG